MNKQAYDMGFIKACSQYGITDRSQIELLYKQAEDSSINKALSKLWEDTKGISGDFLNNPYSPAILGGGLGALYGGMQGGLPNIFAGAGLGAGLGYGAHRGYQGIQNYVEGKPFFQERIYKGI